MRKAGKKEMYYVSVYCIFFVFLLFAFVFENPIEETWKGFGYFDEVIALIAIPILLIKNKNLDTKSLVIMCFLTLFIAIGFAGNYLYNYQPMSVAFKDMFLNIKFWLVMILGEYCGRKFDLKANKKVILLFANVVTFLFVILFLLDNFFGLFAPIIRNGFKSTHLMFYHPTHFAAICVFLIALYISFCDEQKLVFPITLLLLLLCSTLRSKAIAVALVIIILYYWTYVKGKNVKFRNVIFVIPLLIAVGWKQIYWYFFSAIKNDSARNLLALSSFEIANSCFPFGSGYGTFASYFSGVHYSPLYELLGLSTVNGLTVDNYSFVSDSFWPMILGQNGYLGLLIFLIIIIVWIIKISSLQKYNRAYYTAGFVIVAYLLISSMAESSFVNPVAMPVAFWSGILLGNAKSVVCYKY